MDYQKMMQAALLQAKDAAAHGDIPVGAIIVNDLGEIIATGKNERKINNDPTAHAEVVVIRQAGEKTGNYRLDDLTLVVTLEPCVMCAGAILQSRIKRLIFGAFDEKAGAVGSTMDVIRGDRQLFTVEVISGVAKDECAKVLGDFFTTKR